MRCCVGLAVTLLVCIVSCHSSHQPPPRHDIIARIKDLDESVKDNIQQELKFASSNSDSLSDTVILFDPKAIQSLYSTEQYRGIWSAKGKLFPQADSMYKIISLAGWLGLDSEDYYYSPLKSLLQTGMKGPEAHRDAARWARADILLSCAFMKLATQLHYGVLVPDSLSLRKDTAFTDTVLCQLLQQAIRQNAVGPLLDSLEPSYPQYNLLKAALGRYIQTNTGRTWDNLPLANADSADLFSLVASRLLQGGEIDSGALKDKARIFKGLKYFQTHHDMLADGKPGKRTIEALNVTAQSRIHQIDINLERWRRMPDSLPVQYLWINIPSFSLDLWDHDTLRLESRVVLGAPATRTPELSSAILNFQLYPYWRLPMSIILKDVFPGIKKDKQYLEKHNLEVIDRHNNVVDPTKLNWKKFNKNYFPYVLRQMTGLDNSLGIIKFNFRNKYFVYLHDTNERWLFGKDFRALSHGCVRVQKWNALSKYLVKKDTLRHTPDSLAVWETEQLQKQINLLHRLPLFIRYFTCRVNEKGELFFDQDVYGYDSLEEKQMAIREKKEF